LPISPRGEHAVSILRNNLIANYAGSIWIGLMAFAFIPVYVRLMGIEAYGLVGFFIPLQSAFAVLDLGLSTTLTREFARLSILPEPRPPQRALLRTVEMISWVMAVVIGAAILAGARPIAELWIRPERLPIASVTHAIMMMGIVMIVQWPLSIYSSGLLGLQRQISLNKVNAVMATLRGAGAIAALRFIAPTVEVFFAWQVLVTAAHTACVAGMLWRAIGWPHAGRFDRTALTSIWRFAAGLGGITLVTTLLQQTDKLVVSKVLPLSALGYYAIAATVALSLYRITMPLVATLFPRFSQLAAAGDERTLTSLYHRSCEGLSVAMLPAAVFIAFFSRDVLFLWTHDPVTSRETHVILSILVIGTAMSGLMVVPYLVQLAYGWTKLAFGFNLIAVLVLIPGALFLTHRYGAVGASICWTACNTAGALIVPLLMHRRLLKGEQARFYFGDIGPALAVTLITTAALRALIDEGLPTPQLVFALVVSAALVQFAAVAAAPGTRRRAWALVYRRRSLDV
jgi:O-antigen/teichoic acid export membrane protein